MEIVHGIEFSLVVMNIERQGRGVSCREGEAVVITTGELVEPFPSSGEDPVIRSNKGNYIFS